LDESRRAVEDDEGGASRSEDEEVAARQDGIVEEAELQLGESPPFCLAVLCSSAVSFEVFVLEVVLPLMLLVFVSDIPSDFLVTSPLSTKEYPNVISGAVR
tara:strand:+ start:466 stop:768 length:303 start_codon:yes stop_codon:yes gene_type:complete